MVESKMETLVNKLEGLVTRLEQSSGSPQDAGPTAQAPILRKFDSQVLSHVAEFEKQTKAFNNKIIE